MGSTTLASSRSLIVALGSAIPLSCEIILTYPLGGGREGAEWPSSNPPAMLSENRPRTDQRERGHSVKAELDPKWQQLRLSANCSSQQGLSMGELNFTCMATTARSIYILAISLSLSISKYVTFRHTQ